MMTKEPKKYYWFVAYCMNVGGTTGFCRGAAESDAPIFYIKEFEEKMSLKLGLCVLVQNFFKITKEQYDHLL